MKIAWKSNCRLIFGLRLSSCSQYCLCQSTQFVAEYPLSRRNLISENCSVRVWLNWKGSFENSGYRSASFISKRRSMASEYGFSRNRSRRIFRLFEKTVDVHSGWSGLLKKAAMTSTNPGRKPTPSLAICLAKTRVCNLLGIHTPLPSGCGSWSHFSEMKITQVLFDFRATPRRGCAASYRPDRLNFRKRSRSQN